MAVKFKSKYTAQQIEQLLDAVGSTVNGAIIRVEVLPELADALTTSFYECDGKVYYSDGDKWNEVGYSTNEVGGGMPVDPSEGVIGGSINTGSEDEPVEVKAIIRFEDFELYEDDLHFTVKPNSQTDIYLRALRDLMAAEGKTYYTLTQTEAYGFIEEQVENNMLGATAAQNHGHFFIKIDLIDGHEVDITLEQVVDGVEIYLIEYVGLAL